jgi:hypothetical protein
VSRTSDLDGQNTAECGEIPGKDGGWAQKTFEDAARLQPTGEAEQAALSPSAKCGRVGGSGGVAAVRSGLFERLAGANAVAGELAAAHAECSGRRQRSRQNGEGESAGVTDATANPDEVVVVVVGLTEPAAVAGAPVML